MSPVVGRLSDAVGRRPLLILAESIIVLQVRPLPAACVLPPLRRRLCPPPLPARSQLHPPP